MLFTVLVLSVGFVAFTNGANANFKGVASLYGSGTTTLRQATIWGTLTTFIGSIASLVLANGMLAAFSGRGLVPDATLALPAFMSAVAMGAALTSFLATRCGFPVSTTHALVGGLLGAGLAASDHVNVAALGKTVLYPLLVSPLVAALAGAVAYGLLTRVRLVSDRRHRLLDALHFTSAGAASFARGLNDTPKMAALLLAVPGMSANWAIVAVAVIVAVGGLVDSRRVAETLGKKITDMNPGQGFATNLVTALLVTTASWHSQPVSTTHVSVGSLVGMGVVTRQVYWRKIAEIVFVWLSTVPCGAMLSALVYWLTSKS